MKLQRIVAMIAALCIVVCSGCAGKDGRKVGKEVVVYFANWNLGKQDMPANGEVAGLPWESVTVVNHAFWGVIPADGTTETSVERRNSKMGARTEFKIVSTDPMADYEDMTESTEAEGIKRNHFAEYAYFHDKYPDVKILLSIGGWSGCGYFSEMAYTAEGRRGCIESILEVMKTYPFFGGIDIDWEYPGGSKSGERASEGGDDQGCPIFGTAEEDNINFALFLKELKEAMDKEFGTGKKLLTACASASVSWTLPCQDWKSAAPYLDMINIMTYDLAGTWDGATGYQTSLSGAKTAVAYFKVQGVPLNRLCIGVPLYAMAFKMKQMNTAANKTGTACESVKPTYDTIDERMLSEFEAQAKEEGIPGWHTFFAKNQGAACIYNDDENSPYYKWYLSYETLETLELKLDYILENDLAGVIVWESSQDTANYDFIRKMGEKLK